MGRLLQRRRARLGKATLVSREWTSEGDVVEHEAALGNLAELLSSCLEPGVRMPERFTLTGTDAEGSEYSVSFSFAYSAIRRS